MQTGRDYFYRWILVVTYIFIDEHKNLSGYWAIGAIADFVWEKIWIAKEKRNAMREKKISKKNFPAIRISELNPSLNDVLAKKSGRP
jgi:hypothetical protein